MNTGFKVDLSHLHTNIILLNLTDDAAVDVASMTADQLVAKLKEAGRCTPV